MQLKPGTNGIMFGDLLLARLSAHFVFSCLSLAVTYSKEYGGILPISYSMELIQEAC
jgi:hypothetical protein